LLSQHYGSVSRGSVQRFPARIPHRPRGGSRPRVVPILRPRHPALSSADSRSSQTTVEHRRAVLFSTTPILFASSGRHAADDRFICPSRQFAEELQSYLRRRKQGCLPNGVDTGRFAPASAARRSLRQKLGIPFATSSFSGRISIERRRCLLQAFAQRAPACPRTPVGVCRLATRKRPGRLLARNLGLETSPVRGHPGTPEEFTKPQMVSRCPRCVRGCQHVVGGDGERPACLASDTVGSGMFSVKICEAVGGTGTCPLAQRLPDCWSGSTRSRCADAGACRDVIFSIEAVASSYSPLQQLLP